MKNETASTTIKEMPAVIVLVAMPNAGKGTLAEELKKNFPISSLEMGAICRNEVAKNSTIGQEIATYMAKGQLAPNHIITPLAIDALVNASTIMLCDGFPRNLEQAQAMFEAGIEPVIIEITVSEEEAMKRASNRLFCPKCRANYTKNNFKPSKVPGICDIDGSALEQRADDANPDVVKARLDVYREKTYPILDFFRDHNIQIHSIDGSEAAHVYDRATEIIENLL